LLRAIAGIQAYQRAARDNNRKNTHEQETIKMKKAPECSEAKFRTFRSFPQKHGWLMAVL
jgi:hypothetical protein